MRSLFGAQSLGLRISPSSLVIMGIRLVLGKAYLSLLVACRPTTACCCSLFLLLFLHEWKPISDQLLRGCERGLAFCFARRFSASLIPSQFWDAVKDIWDLRLLALGQGRGAFLGLLRQVSGLFLGLEAILVTLISAWKVSEGAGHE